MNSKELRVLIVEDNKPDAHFIMTMLAESRVPAFSFSHAQRLSDGLTQLREKSSDIILLDLGLPDSQMMDTLLSVRRQSPAVPLVVLTGLDDEEFALETIRRGADDYLIKTQINKTLLIRTIRYTIERKRMEEERENLKKNIQDALNTVKTLSGLLPICAHCKKIRDDKGYWNQIEAYISEHSEAEFSHSICPECAKKFYPEYYDKVKGKNSR
jgi:PleD family two-component response regulator